MMFMFVTMILAFQSTRYLVRSKDLLSLNILPQKKQKQLWRSVKYLFKFYFTLLILSTAVNHYHL